MSHVGGEEVVRHLVNLQDALLTEALLTEGFESFAVEVFFSGLWGLWH